MNIYNPNYNTSSSSSIPLENVCNNDNPNYACYYGDCIYNEILGYSECICNNDLFENEYNFFRINNCATPKYIIPITQSINITFGIIAIILVLRSFSSQNENMKQILRPTLLSLIFLTLIALVTTIQNYASPLFWLFNACSVTFVAITFSLILNTFFEISIKSLRVTANVKLIKNGLVAGTIMIGLPLWILAFYIIYLDFVLINYDAKLYNSAIAICYALFPTHLIITISLSNHVCNDLLTKFNESKKLVADYARTSSIDKEELSSDNNDLSSSSSPKFNKQLSVEIPSSPSSSSPTTRGSKRIPSVFRSRTNTSKSISSPSNAVDKTLNRIKKYKKFVNIFGFLEFTSMILLALIYYLKLNIIFFVVYFGQFTMFSGAIMMTIVVTKAYKKKTDNDNDNSNKSSSNKNKIQDRSNLSSTGVNSNTNNLSSSAVVISTN